MIPAFFVKPQFWEYCLGFFAPAVLMGLHCALLALTKPTMPLADDFLS